MEAGFRDAVKLYEEALEHDLTFAPAHVGLAESLGMLANYGIVPPADEVRTRALGAIDRALPSTPESADSAPGPGLPPLAVRVRLGRRHRRDERALALNPQSPTPSTGLGYTWA
ncbi:MAG: hypothetical protein R2745_14710 [Vicinamibacterales bacterium]